MEKGALDYFDKLDAMGGMVRAIENGYPQKEVAEASYQYQRAVEAKEKIVVGVNDFTVEEKQPETLYIDESVARQQTRKLQALRARRDNAEVRRRLDALKRAAAQEPVVPVVPGLQSSGRVSDANTMPYIIDCVRAYSTVGEICDALREVYGTYKELRLT